MRGRGEERGDKGRSRGGGRTSEEKEKRGEGGE